MPAITYDDWVKDLRSVREEEQSVWIYETLKSKRFLNFFGRYFFPHVIKGTEDVPDCHLQLIEELNKDCDSAVIFPRGFAKSTWEKIDTIHDIVYSLEPVILYISSILQDAKFHFESIKNELENNELLRFVYGDIVPSRSAKSAKWTNTHFETTNEVNVVARGAGKGRGVNIKNQRPTKIICDDVEFDEQVKSAARREKLHRWLTEVVFPSKNKERGKIKMIGTVLHEEAEILQFYEKHGGIFRKAIEDGKSIWPNYYSLEDLEKIKEKIGTRAFSQEYMNTPASDEMANFKPAWIDENCYTLTPAFQRVQTVIYMDPQAGETAQADEFAITVLSWEERDRHRYVIEQEAGRMSQFDQAKQLVKKWLFYKNKKFNVKIVAVEKVLNQTAVFQIILDWKAGKINFNKDGILPGDKDWIDESNRGIPFKGTSPEGKDKVARLQMHESSFERGEIHLRPEMKTLRAQILFLGRDVIEHDDRCDSLVGALDLSYINLGFLLKKDKKVYNKEKKETVAGNLYNQQF